MKTPFLLRHLLVFLFGALSAPAAQPLRSVAITVGDLGNPFFVQIAKGAEAKARELGGAGVKITAVSSGYDLNQQTNQMEDFIAAKVDLIVLNA
ncbi:MAG: substrate-binding domain-containing protein, partial [Opitutaceae bacterium]